VGDALHLLSQSVTRQKVVEPDHVRIADAFQPDVDVADEHKQFEVSQQAIQHISEISAEADDECRRSRTTEDGAER